MKNNNAELVHEIKKELEDLKHNLKGAFSKSGEVLSDKSKALLENTIESFHERVEKVTDAVKEKSQNVDDIVHEHPWQVAGAALAVGLLTGLLIGRSRD
ncbi:MAG: hypothetical protein A3A86_06900 [Elusimicrobia bacterium RIFCSPLOWO2_01_FULL_60_11]|nr:MAG: hypothetical protein A3A86_06900 [Elusimicrobia bacterium RIFCSPLOWO2_01_FULL_60_11]